MAVTLDHLARGRGLCPAVAGLPPPSRVVIRRRRRGHGDTGRSNRQGDRHRMGNGRGRGRRCDLEYGVAARALETRGARGCTAALLAGGALDDRRAAPPSRRCPCRPAHNVDFQPKPAPLLVTAALGVVVEVQDEPGGTEHPRVGLSDAVHSRAVHLGPLVTEETQPPTTGAALAVARVPTSNCMRCLGGVDDGEALLPLLGGQVGLQLGGEGQRLGDHVADRDDHLVGGLRGVDALCGTHALVSLHTLRGAAR